MAWMSQSKGRIMKKAKNTITTRAAFIAGLVMLLCCVASAGPTYSFVKIAGEWSFYEESGVLNSTFEVSPANPGPSIGTTARTVNADSELSLPAVGSIVRLSSSGSSSGGSTAYVLLDRTNGRTGGVRSTRASVNVGADGDVSVAGDAYPGTSTYLLQSTLTNGFENPEVGGRSLNGRLPNGTADTPESWEYWNNIDNQDIATPVPVPVPGSIILAAIGAGLVKLLHDRRLNR
jgi:hypothetical protein